MDSNLKLWNVEFEPLYPVGGCLIILAKDKEEAFLIAQHTIHHTSQMSVSEIEMDGSGVVFYDSGNY